MLIQVIFYCILLFAELLSPYILDGLEIPSLMPRRFLCY